MIFGKIVFTMIQFVPHIMQNTILVEIMTLTLHVLNAKNLQQLHIQPVMIPSETIIAEYVGVIVPIEHIIETIPQHSMIISNVILIADKCGMMNLITLFQFQLWVQEINAIKINVYH